MPKVIVRPATAADLIEIAGSVAPEQVKLCYQLGDTSIDDAISRSLGGSQLKWSARVHGKLVAVYGVYPIEGGCGAPWLYATPEIAKYPADAYIVAHSAINAMLLAYPRLFGVVDGRFERSVNFARHLGFAIGTYQGVVEPPLLTIERTAA